MQFERLRLPCVKTGRMTAMLLSFVLLTGNFIKSPAQDQAGYQFTEDLRIPSTPVKNQGATNNCYIYAVLSLFESELLRAGKGEYDLSEMYLVRSIYLQKAKKFMRMHGNMYFPGGGELNDVPDNIQEFCVIPEDMYQGHVAGESIYDQTLLEDSLRSFMEQTAENSLKMPVPGWEKSLSGILDQYMGSLPDSLCIGKMATYPLKYYKSLDINPEDFILLTSFMHHPYYKPFSIEVPDNWSWGQAYNLPLNELTETIYYALNQGYTIAWATDDSEKGFSWESGIAIVPDEDNHGFVLQVGDVKKLNEGYNQKELFFFRYPVKERIITPEIRQAAFDSLSTTDDHSMHIIGFAHDQNKISYFIVKNSWGTENTRYNGYLYVSESYMQYKTISKLLHRKGLPPAIL